MKERGSSRRARARLLALACVTAAVVAPASALGASSQSVYLTGAPKFRGYTVSVGAYKSTSSPTATVSVSLYKASQSHYYSFTAKKTDIVVSSTLGSGKIKLGSLSARATSRLVRKALASYGSGTITFGATGARTSKTCKNGAKQKTRPVKRTSGSLTFTPTKKGADRFTRSAFKGSVTTVSNGTYCEVSFPVTCPHYVSLYGGSSSSSGTTSSLSATRRGTTLSAYFSFSPSSASIKPAAYVSHGRSVTTKASRLTNSTDLQHAKLTLNGITGWSGVVNFAASTPASSGGESCKTKTAYGSTTGTAKAALDFVAEKAFTGSSFASLSKQ